MVIIMKKCEFCGEVSEDTATYCGSCGGSLVEENYGGTSQTTTSSYVVDSGSDIPTKTNSVNNSSNGFKDSNCILAFVLSLLSFVFNPILFFSIYAIVLGVKGSKKAKQYKGFAIAAIPIGIIATILSFVTMVVSVLAIVAQFM